MCERERERREGGRKEEGNRQTNRQTDRHKETEVCVKTKETHTLYTSLTIVINNTTGDRK